MHRLQFSLWQEGELDGAWDGRAELDGILEGEMDGEIDGACEMLGEADGALHVSLWHHWPLIVGLLL